MMLHYDALPWCCATLCCGALCCAAPMLALCCYSMLFACPNAAARTSPSKALTGRSIFNLILAVRIHFVTILKCSMREKRERGRRGEEEEKKRGRRGEEDGKKTGRRGKEEGKKRGKKQHHATFIAPPPHYALKYNGKIHCTKLY